jgi:hypothetical protein
MRKTPKQKKTISAEQIARMATRGEDISRFFTNRLRMVYPIQRVNVDFTGPMLAELDDAAKELNISRQAVIKTLVREGLDRRLPRRAVSRQTPARVHVPGGSRRVGGK